MKLTGARTLRATPQEVWDFLMTPSRLRGCLPGCERFEATSPDTFEGTMRLGIGFLKGTYTGTLRVAEQRHPEHLRLEVQGGGMLGALTAAGTVRLVDAVGGTYLLYEGEASVTGRVAAVGQRVIEATATKLFGRFFDCVASNVEHV